ncbi:MAG: bifunctional 5,10-methylenetetrahydrofolate dehydrogenase/5,10-methenyltetrahydrofolate cyclohydrolase, partial [Planctomycetota bacterium]
MTAQLLDGKKLASQIRAELAEEVRQFTQISGRAPSLTAVIVGDDPASRVYVRNKRKDCAEVAMTSSLLKLPTETAQPDLLETVEELNQDEEVDGILVQLPLPEHIDASAVLEAIDPAKDVDAFHPDNVGRLVQGRPRFLPCTPSGVQQLLLRNRTPISGRRVVVVGRSDIVGKPLAIMLGLRGVGGDATVTLCHSRTNDLASLTRQADILIAAIGKPKFVSADMVRPGATVVD